MFGEIKHTVGYDGIRTQFGRLPPLLMMMMMGMMMMMMY